VLFLALIAEPVFRKITDGGRIPSLVRPWLAWMQWIALALVVLSGAAWFILKAAEMGDVAWRDAFSEDLVPIVLSGTDFGHDWIVRAGLAALLIAALFAAQPARAGYRLASAAACVLAAGLSGSLAWAGHAAASPGALGGVHLGSDILHLVAASAWGERSFRSQL
jgi:putative copper resistance protein D